MRRIIAIAVILSLIIAYVPLYAAEGGKKGASARAFERASDQAIFHRVADWFATRGKSKEEKEAILTERRAKRAAIRAQKEAEKKKKRLEKEARKKKKMLEKETRKAQKGIRD